MKKYLFICIGGAAGAIVRYALESVSLIPGISPFPINTLLINLSGSFLLTYLMTIFFEAWEVAPEIRLGIGVGFLGAYTTFSTFCKESVNLFLSGDHIVSALYIFISIIFGVLVSFLGLYLARFTIRSIIERRDKNKTSEEETELD